LRPTSPAKLIQQLQAVGISRLQIALDPLRTQPGRWGKLFALAVKSGLRIGSGMFGAVGEDYTTLESIRRTGGVVPDATWDENWRNIQENAIIAARVDLKLVTFHAGFLPHDPNDPAFDKLLQRIRQIADLFAEKGIDLGLETGQETAATLRSFLKRLDRENVGVNFDPANMILYDKGDPIAALRELGPWLKQCHIKDAIKTKVPGTWGEEVVVGTGQVDWGAFFKTLEEVGFYGKLAIEREAGNQRVADIRAAREFIEKIVA
jgi:sugar phosphate isomerase/epimerase